MKIHEQPKWVETSETRFGTCIQFTLECNRCGTSRSLEGTRSKDVMRILENTKQRFFKKHSECQINDEDLKEQEPYFRDERDKCPPRPIDPEVYKHGR